MTHRVLVYDDNCPLCSWYSGLFVKFGLLSPSGRKPFSAIGQDLLSRIDLDRSRNEIPLVDLASGQTWYGIDALLEILGQKMNFIKTVGSIRPFNWVLKKLYKFISYNRKVIVAKKCGTGAIDCAPDMNYFYRLLFMMLFLCFNTTMLFPLHSQVLTSIPGYSVSIAELQMAHFILVFINCGLAFCFEKKKSVEFLGQVNMLAVSGILLLLPLLLINNYLSPDKILVMLYLAVVMVIIFKEYIRRMEYAGILTTNQWVAGINLFCMTAFLLFVFH